MKIGYKISDNFVVIKCPKNGCTTVMIQSLCYNEHKKIDEYNDLQFKHADESIYGRHLWLYSNKYLINCDNVKYYPNEKLIFIFRDPIKRLLSAYKNWFIGRNKTIDEFVKFVKEDIETYKDNINIINEHYRPQYSFINFDDIDIFIEQKDYEMFCKEHGIQYLKTNQNKDLSYQSKIELTDEHISILKDLYKEDYEMIEKIKNSGKLYNGLIMSNLNVNDIDDFRGFDIIISHKYKFIYCLIQKCGSSSILYSIYKHEFNKEYDVNYIIWEQIRYNKKLHNIDKICFSFKRIEDLINFSNEFKDYRKFIVIRDVKERFISWLNFASFLFKFDLPQNNEKDYIFNNVVNIYNEIYNDYHKPFIESGYLNQNKIEYHCLPQSVFYDFFKKCFQDQLEIVELNNLKQYLHDNYGFELIKNNENKNKFITINNLSKSELSIINNISLHDNIWDIIKTRNQQ